MDPATSINHRWAARTLRGERMFHFGVQSRVTEKTRTRDAQQENKRTPKGVIFLLWFLFFFRFLEKVYFSDKALCQWSQAAGGGNPTSKVAVLRPAVSAQQIPNDRSDLHKAALWFHRVSFFCPSEKLCHGDARSSSTLGKRTVRRCVF